MSTLGEIKNLPNISIFPQFTYEKHEEKVYNGNTYYVLTGRARCTTLERTVSAVKALALTIISCGIALIFTQVREFWKHALFGIKQVKVQATDVQLPASIKSIIYNSWNQDPKAVHLNATLTKEEALKMLKKRTVEFEELPLHLQQDPSFLLNFIKDNNNNEGALFFLSPSHPIFANENILLELLKLIPSLIVKTPKDLFNKKEFLLKAIKICHGAVNSIPLPACYSEDKQLISKWMKYRLDTFHVISKNLQEDTSFIDQLKEKNSDLEAYLKCKDKGFNDETAVLDLIKIDPTAFNLIPESMKSDISFLTKALKANKKTILYFPRGFQQDVVSKLLENQNEAVSNAMDCVMELAIMEDHSLLLNEIIMEKVITKAKELDLLPYHLLNNRDFLLKMLKIEDLYKGSHCILPNKFANDQEVILKWMSRGITIEDMGRISSTLKKDPEFIKKAKECCNKIKKDFEQLLKLDKIRNATADEALQLVTKDPTLMDKIDPNLQDDKDFLIKCVKQNWDIISKINRSLLAEREFVARICAETGKTQEDVLTSVSIKYRTRIAAAKPIDIATVNSINEYSEEESSRSRSDIRHITPYSPADGMQLPPSARSLTGISPHSIDHNTQPFQASLASPPNLSLWQPPLMPPVGPRIPLNPGFTPIWAPGQQLPVGSPIPTTPPTAEVSMMDFIETSYGPIPPRLPNGEQFE